jgi:hypothetical protein
MLQFQTFKTNYGGYYQRATLTMRLETSISMLRLMDAYVSINCPVPCYYSCNALKIIRSIQN